MTLLKLCIAGTIVALSTAAIIPAVTNRSKSQSWQCSTDMECTQECLTRCIPKEECRNCWDIFINEDNYDLYERRYEELMWKYEAY